MDLVPKSPKCPHRGRGIRHPTPSPLVSNTLLNSIKTASPPHILYCNYYTFSARIDVNLNFIMHINLGFSTLIYKKSQIVGSHTLPLSVNRNDPTYIVLQSYTFGAGTDVNLNFLMHQKHGFSTPKSKNVPTVGGGYPLSHPPPWCPIKYLTALKKLLPPLYTFSAIIDDDLNSIMY